MRQMKDSGIEWIGKIPETWNVIAFQQATERMATGLNPRNNFVLTATDDFFYVTIKNFKNGKLFLDENCDKISDEANAIIQQRSQLRKGDILFASISEEGNAYIIDEEPLNWNINESVFTIRVNPKRMLGKYFYYHLTNVGYYGDLRNDATGATFQSIKQNQLKKSRVVMPPLSEQFRIADYLDKKCAEIDAIIAAKEKTNEFLKERRQSIIYEAVTKGLDPNVPMKDSGIEWIGQIPENWTTCKIKHFVANEDGVRIGPFGSALTNRLLENGEYNVYSQANLISGDFSSTKHTIDEKTFDDLANYEVRSDDICVSMMGTIGKCMVVPSGIKRGIMDSHLIKIRLKSHINPKYFEYVYDKDNSGLCFTQMKRDSKGTIMDGLNSTIVKNLFFPLPSRETQNSIVEYLNKKCAEIDALISANHSTIDKLKEYRQSIIYEAVTGKIEV